MELRRTRRKEWLLRCFEDGDDEWAEKMTGARPGAAVLTLKQKAYHRRRSSPYTDYCCCYCRLCHISAKQHKREKGCGGSDESGESHGRNTGRSRFARSSEPPAADVQTEITVGALDDAQDPQDSEAAGNEKSGAEVTVAPRPEGETEGLTMGIDVSKWNGSIDWNAVKTAACPL